MVGWFVAWSEGLGVLNGVPDGVAAGAGVAAVKLGGADMVGAGVASLPGPADGEASEAGVTDVVGRPDAVGMAGSAPSRMAKICAL
jgi:hypothetical protein